MSLQQRPHLFHESDVLGLPVAGGVVQWLIDQELGARHFIAHRLEVEPDSAVSHRHPGAEEVFYVVQGSGEVRVENAAQVVGQGCAVFIPDGAEHHYVNIHAEPLIVLGAMAPPMDPVAIRPANAPLDLAQPRSRREIRADLGSAMIDERRVKPTMMGERSFRVLANQETGTRHLTQFTGIIPTGRAPLHAHPHEEMVYIVAGTGRLWIDDDPVGPLRPGSVVFCPIGIRHTLENTGPQAMKVLGIFSPAGSPDAKLATPG